MPSVLVDSCAHLFRQLADSPFSSWSISVTLSIWKAQHGEEVMRWTGGWGGGIEVTAGWGGQQISAGWLAHLCLELVHNGHCLG